ncbi:hypothetical protein [Enterococcus diestrammenae]|uniref:Uncharacterized protein n=1 Tax=Enterococcus diestrammenae TaxID=1155073 RepID=A0ABV0EZ18_9ENTE|nr:hypothetical protein [Enterococcus diestrammenae]KAF1294787.1 hypothetical protein BAU18_03535 [Enterococcus diestrammenae]
MAQSKNNKEFQVKKVIFQALCKNHGWSLEALSQNPKNRKQWIARCLDDQGMPRNILRTESGKFIELFGGKKWREFSYVGTETVSEDSSGVS